MSIVGRIRCLFAAVILMMTAASPADAARSGQQSRRLELANATAWRALEAWRMNEARRLVARLAPGPARQCAEGVIANRDNRVRVSVLVLERCLSSPDLRPMSGVLAGETLMDGYAKIFDYGAQSRTGTRLIKRYVDVLTKSRRADILSDQAMASALARAGTRRQTVIGTGPVTLRTSTNAMGTIETELIGNGVPSSWMIDTGANYSVLTDSLAKRMGVVPLEAGVDVSDSREQTSTVRLGVIRTLEVGTVTFHDVVAYIVPDDVLRVRIGGTVHRIAAILGHPVLSALGRVTLDAKGSMTADPNAPVLARGGRMYMRMLTPLLETTTIGRDALFGLDTGANVTSLFAPFARALPGGMAALHKESRVTVGVSSSGTGAEAILPELRLLIGDDLVTIPRVGVDPGHGKEGPRFGNVGLDVLKGRSTMTIDYRSMRLLVGPPE